MRFEETADEGEVYVLASGRRIYANCLILGLGPGDDCLVSHGYDGDLESSLDPPLTVAERHEIGIEMIVRWVHWMKRTP